LPAGTTIVSPDLAIEIAVFTSAKEGLAAWITSAYVTEIVLLMLLEFDPALAVRVID
jgi:hypothetical protein